MPANKPVPRFVPTLTEVVQPGLSVTPPPAPIDPAQLAEQVLKLVKPRLEQQLRASLQSVIEQHLKAAAPRMPSELQEAIQAAASQALANTQPPKD